MRAHHSHSEKNIPSSPVARRPDGKQGFRSFRVKYSPTNVSTSVGHACLFGDKRWGGNEAYRDDECTISFAQLYRLVMGVAYTLRHLDVNLGDKAYLDAGEDSRGLVGLLGALRAGCTVLLAGDGLKPAERDRVLGTEQCRVLLTVRPETVEVTPGVEVIDLTDLVGLILPKELDWLLPRPLPDQLAIMVPDGAQKERAPRETMQWRGFNNRDLTSRLRGEGGSRESVDLSGLPFRDVLVHLARSKTSLASGGLTTSS